MVCAIAALASALLTLVALSGRPQDSQPSAASFHDPLHPGLPGELENPSAAPAERPLATDGV